MAARLLKEVRQLTLMKLITNSKLASELPAKTNTNSYSYLYVESMSADLTRLPTPPKQNITHCLCPVAVGIHQYGSQPTPAGLVDQFIW